MFERFRFIEPRPAVSQCYHRNPTLDQ